LRDYQFVRYKTAVGDLDYTAVYQCAASHNDLAPLKKQLGHSIILLGYQEPGYEYK